MRLVLVAALTILAGCAGGPKGTDRDDTPEAPRNEPQQHWGTVRDHVEAWYFQLTTETETIEPEGASKGLTVSMTVWPDGDGGRTLDLPRCLKVLADHSGLPVVFDTEFTNDFRETLILRHFGLNRWVNPPTLVEEITSSLVLQALEQMGWHVLEQRFPRRAYVVIRDPSEPVVLAPLDGTEAIYQCPTCKDTVAWIYGSSIRKGIPTGRKVVVHTCPICKADWLAGIPPSNECAACHVMDKKCPTCAAHVGGP